MSLLVMTARSYPFDLAPSACRITRVSASSCEEQRWSMFLPVKESSIPLFQPLTINSLPSWAACCNSSSFRNFARAILLSFTSMKDFHCSGSLRSLLLISHLMPRPLPDRLSLVTFLLSVLNSSRKSHPHVCRAPYNLSGLQQQIFHHSHLMF